MSKLEKSTITNSVAKMSNKTLDIYKEMLLQTYDEQNRTDTIKNSITKEQIIDYIEASEFAAELVCNIGILDCETPEDLEAFYNDNDSKIIDDTALLLSGASYLSAKGMDLSESEKAVFAFLSTKTAEEYDKNFGEEKFVADKAREKQNVMQNAQQYVSTNGAVAFEGVQFNKDKLKKIVDNCATESYFNRTEEQLVFPDYYKAYKKQLLHRKEFMDSIQEVDVNTSFTDVGYAYADNRIIPFSQKKDYAMNSYLEQLPMAMSYLETSGKTMDYYADNPTAMLSDAADYSLKMNASTGAYMGVTESDMITFVKNILNKGIKGVVDVDRIKSTTRALTNVLMSTCSDEQGLSTADIQARKEAFMQNFDALKVNPELNSKEPLLVVASYKNMFDAATDIGIDEAKKFPKANKFDYIKNLIELKSVVVNCMTEATKEEDFDKQMEKLQIIDNEIKNKKLGFWDKLFHPFKSAAALKNIADVERNMERIDAIKLNNIWLNSDEKNKLANCFDKDTIKDLGNMGLGTLESRLPTRKSFIRIAMLTKVPIDEVFAEPKSAEYLAKEQEALQEIRQAAKTGDKEYFKNLFVNGAKCFSELKIPKLDFTNKHKLMEGLKMISTIGVTVKDFEQIQGGKAALTGKTFYAHADKKFVDTCSKALGCWTNMSIMANGVMQAFKSEYALVGKSLDNNLVNNTNLIKGAAALDFFKNNQAVLSGNKMQDVACDVEKLAISVACVGVLNSPKMEECVAAKNLIMNPLSYKTANATKLGNQRIAIQMEATPAEALIPFPEQSRVKLVDKDKTFTQQINPPVQSVSQDLQKTTNAPSVEKSIQ